MENLSIKLVIGNRSYPMKVPIEDEQKIRNIGKDLNKRISEIKSQMNIDDLQDILAMIAFKLSVELEDNKGQTSENKDAYKKIENIINEIDEEIKYYRRLDRQSHSGKVKDPYNDDKLLDKNQIKSKIYELYAIKYHVVYSQIEEARAEIVRPAEQAHPVRVHPTEQTSIINGGKRKIMKGGGGSLSRIQRNSTIYNSKIMDHVKIGPYSHIRPNCEISSYSKIGNFVEIKNSQLDEQVKVNHLTYIGDSKIGRNTNIGAGTITANFDGTKKHPTNIGKNSNIGANTVLIAPINLGDSVTTGAGSVITKDSQNNSLAIARSKQVNIKNWKKTNP